MNTYEHQADYYVQPSKIGAWFREPAVRETFESVLVAVLLALLFRCFEAEAYIIPTGSMAPDLHGQHIDVVCPECNYDYRVGAGCENASSRGPQTLVEHVVCPICSNKLLLKRHLSRDNRSFPGDRILVNKFAYDFAQPDRWDVIVFKNPNNGKQNFIKRLVGLPGEGVLIENGDIYTYDRENQSFEQRKIARKQQDKLWEMLQMVDDTDYIAAQLELVQWPSRWNQWRDRSGDDWLVSASASDAKYTVSGNSADVKWLRYRHLAPRVEDWEQISIDQLPKRFRNQTVPPGELIRDHYGYNTYYERNRNYDIPAADAMKQGGFHWVGDLAVRAWINVGSDEGTLKLDLVEGGAHFICSIDIQSGQATLSCNDPSVKLAATPTATSSLKGAGDYVVTFANADDQLFLWINGKLVQFDDSTYSRIGNVLPKWNRAEPGDAEPVGIGSQQAELTISRLQVMRNIYYTSKNSKKEIELNPNAKIEYVGYRDPLFILDVLRNPMNWELQNSVSMFDSRRGRDQSYVFELEPTQLFPMGDNSPESNDARIWEGNSYIDESYLLGEALLIYWPHAKTKPIPFWPNFGRMGFIH